jgi:acyl-CoA synthetase (AMP-forming)/AMP-acid ligase II
MGGLCWSPFRHWDQAVSKVRSAHIDLSFRYSTETSQKRLSELVMACVVLKTGATLNADDLIAFCRQSLASYKLPRRIEFSETDLPKSSSGKVLKRTLRESFWTHQQRAVS